MAFLRILRWLLLLSLLAAAGAVAFALLQGRGGRGLPVAGGDSAPDGGACQATLERSGVAYRTLAPRSQGASCGYRDGIAWASGGARAVAYAPAAPTLACPLAAALATWEWDVVQPAAVRAFGTTVARIDHFGSYACRRIAGGRSSGWSEHARAAAIDVAGFQLSDGRRITVAGDWTGKGPEARFLREVRDGACRLFATTLSPDYNAAHRDHLHLDEAKRGGWRACR